MLYADNEAKFVAILNRKITVPRLMNALGHSTAGLISLCPDTETMKFLRYEDADGGAHPAISHFPFIVLEAKNGNQIRTLRQTVIEQGILFNDFADKMLGGSAEEQLQNTRNTKESDLEYFAIVLFGPAEVLNVLTRKFSLFRGPSSSEELLSQPTA
jgi:hypothetical protein